MARNGRQFACRLQGRVQHVRQAVRPQDLPRRRPRERCAGQCGGEREAVGQGFTAGAFPGSGQIFNYLEGPVPQLDTVQIDSTHGPEFLSGEAQLAKYRAHLDWMERIALSPQASRDFIRDVANSL